MSLLAHSVNEAKRRHGMVQYITGMRNVTLAVSEQLNSLKMDAKRIASGSVIVNIHTNSSQGCGWSSIGGVLTKLIYRLYCFNSVFVSVFLSFLSRIGLG